MATPGQKKSSHSLPQMFYHTHIDRSGVKFTAIRQCNAEESTRIKIRQCKYLNNVIEQDHRPIKRLTKPMLGFKACRCAQATLAGIELIRLLRKGQMRCQAGRSKTPAELFYGLAG